MTSLKMADRVLAISQRFESMSTQFGIEFGIETPYGDMHLGQHWLK